jgi:SAM-dependent methyltransferase
MARKYEAEVNLENKNSSHTLIVEMVGYNKHVLDVGSSTGYLAELLVKCGCQVTGIEVDLEAARQAEEHCERVIVGDVEILDVCEKLAYESLKPFLRSEGYVVTSIPNVAHGSVRLALMQGNFQYSSSGLLDDTHLRFFTRGSVEQLFDDAGFEIISLKRTTRDVFDTEIELDQRLVTQEVLQLVQNDPEALTYQFVLAARPSGASGPVAWPYTRAGLLLEQIGERDRKIYELNRKLRNLQDLQRQLEYRSEQLAEREEEVASLTQGIIERNQELAKSERQIRRLNDEIEKRERQITRLNDELEQLRAE